MNLFKIFAAMLFTGSAWSAYAAPKQEAIADARIFAMNYTQSQETVKAQFAKGNPNGTLVPANIAMRFDFDPLSTTNYGLKVGANRAGVRYQAA